MLKQQNIPAEPKPEQIRVVTDSREQCSLDVSPLQSVTGTLTTGDYSVVGLANIIAIERKSLPDFLACVGGERERIEREVQRLLAYPVRALVVEATWQQLEAGGWQSEITPEAAIGSALGWVARGLPVVMAENHERAGKYVACLLFIAARQRWREARALVGSSLKEGATV